MDRGPLLPFPAPRLLEHYLPDEKSECCTDTNIAESSTPVQELLLKGGVVASCSSDRGSALLRRAWIEAMREKSNSFLIAERPKKDRDDPRFDYHCLLSALDPIEPACVLCDEPRMLEAGCSVQIHSAQTEEDAAESLAKSMWLSSGGEKYALQTMAAFLLFQGGTYVVATELFTAGLDEGLSHLHASERWDAAVAETVRSIVTDACEALALMLQPHKAASPLLSSVSPSLFVLCPVLEEDDDGWSLDGHTLETVPTSSLRLQGSVRVVLSKPGLVQEYEGVLDEQLTALSLLLHAASLLVSCRTLFASARVEGEVLAGVLAHTGVLSGLSCATPSALKALKDALPEKARESHLCAQAKYALEDEATIEALCDDKETLERRLLALVASMHAKSAASLEGADPACRGSWHADLHDVVRMQSLQALERLRAASEHVPQS